jgi:hypothetical protein
MAGNDPAGLEVAGRGDVAAGAGGRRVGCEFLVRYMPAGKDDGKELTKRKKGGN